MRLSAAHRAIIEEMIEESSLHDVLEAIGEICDQKSEHILEAWQDEKLAKKWTRAATVLVRASNHRHIEEAS